METVETTEQGVNEEATPAETSPVSEEAKEPTPSEGGEEQLPFGKHPRWQKMLSQNKQLSSEIQTLKTQMERYNSLSSLDSAFRDLASKDPNRFREVLSLLNGEKAQQQDPYNEFDPFVAEKLRKVDEIDSWRAEIEQLRAETNKQTIDNHFQTILEKEGFVKDGRVVDEGIVGVIEDAVIEALNRQTNGNIARATTEQVNEATSRVIQGINAVKRLALKQTIKQNNVPATGSRSGAPVPTQSQETDDDRINLISSILAQGQR